jgi:hypothetical protein
MLLTEEQIAASIAVISASFMRKHTECSPEWVADQLELADVQPCIHAVLEASGFIRAASPNVPSP